ncbi:MAG: Methyl-accepting chemotaxis protein II [Candidatus Erwinia impunctatus]|nr:Methyl-accepting chemotaxis protein II [Culicoides impunctatus]
MTLFSLRDWRLGTKLSVMTSLTVVVLILILTLALTHHASTQIQRLTQQNMENQVRGISDMTALFSSTLSEEVGNYTTLFLNFLPKRFSLDEDQLITVGQTQSPTLRAGLKTLNLDQVLVNDFQERTGAVSTVFVRMGDEYLRVSTSLRNQAGERVVGTFLDKQSPAWQKIHQGETYQGVSLLFGKRYITQYQPVKDSNGKVVGVLFVGIDITKQYAEIRDKILDKSIGDNGRFYVINNTQGEQRGSFIFHPTEEGKRPDWPDSVAQQMLNQPQGVQESHDHQGGPTLLVWQQLPGWNWVIMGEVSETELLAPVHHSRNVFLMIGGALVAMFFLAFSYTVRRWISLPLQHVITQAREYSAGHLQATMRTSRRDEVGQLIYAINGIGEGLARIVLQVRTTTDEINHGTQTITASSTEISQHVSSQASSVEQTSASLEQLSASVKQTAANVDQTSELASKAAVTTQHGNDTVARSVLTMSEIKTASHNIAEITSVIESIAFQTNILALNAAVEAARAGEHGKGFAVVAAEVRALAQRSAHSAKEIGELIQNSINKIAQGHSLSEEMREVMESVAQGIEEFKLLINEINIAAKEQAAGISQVNLAMNQISQATQQNSAQITAAEHAAVVLNEKGEHLSQLVSIFVVKEKEVA